MAWQPWEIGPRPPLMAATDATCQILCLEDEGGNEEVRPKRKCAFFHLTISTFQATEETTNGRTRLVRHLLKLL